MSKPLLCLDRDGVINRMVMDAEHGTIDSPLHPSQVQLVATAPNALQRLEKLGFDLVIISNQPSAAKGKTTKANLDQTHDEIVKQLTSAGVHVRGSYICFHQASEHCACRKPAIGLLEQAFAAHPAAPKEKSWMIGDGITDIQAGQRFGLKTAFLAAHKCDVCQAFQSQAHSPTVWADDLQTLADQFERGLP